MHISDFPFHIYEIVYKTSTWAGEQIIINRFVKLEERGMDPSDHKAAIDVHTKQTAYQRGHLQGLYFASYTRATCITGNHIQVD
jgi:hypothetical protein